MAGITIHSGDISAKQSDLTMPTSPQPLNVLILGDFSGRASQGLINPETLVERKLHRIDKDSFEEVFAKLHVRLKVSIADEPIAFHELDDLHPDHLYQNIDLFARYRQILRQLNSTRYFHDAVQALTEEGVIQSAKPPEGRSVERGESANLLDDLLAGGSNYEKAAAFDVAALIRQTVAPYVEPARDPKAEEYIAAVERALSDVMRKIMHASAFRALEASWRSLDLLNRKLDSDREVHIHILDVCKQELLEDGHGSENDPARTILGRRLLDQVSVRGAVKIDCLLLDAPLSGSAADASVVTYLGHLARGLNARLLMGTTARQLGRDSFVDFAARQSPTLDSHLNDASWQAIRGAAFARSIYLSAPGFLLRLPYGKNSNQVEAFAYEELAGSAQHASYLWGNGAYLLVMGLLQAMQRGRDLGKCDGTWACIDNMPMHVYGNQDGDECVTPGAEVFLSAKQVAELEHAGLTVLQSVKNSDQILIGRWRPFADMS